MNKELIEAVGRVAELQKKAVQGTWYVGEIDSQPSGRIWHKGGGLIATCAHIEGMGGPTSAFIAESGNLPFADLHTALLAATPTSLSSGGGAGQDEQWVIVSMIDGRGKPYWRPDSRGYTDSFADAGRYSYEAAAAITSTCHGDAEKYCVDDPALYELIAYENLARGKEIELWLENQKLRAQLAAGHPAISPSSGGAATSDFVALAKAAWHLMTDEQAGPDGWLMAKRWAFDGLRAALKPFRTEKGDALDLNKLASSLAGATPVASEEGGAAPALLHDLGGLQCERYFYNYKTTVHYAPGLGKWILYSEVRTSTPGGGYFAAATDAEVRATGFDLERYGNPSDVREVAHLAAEWVRSQSAPAPSAARVGSPLGGGAAAEPMCDGERADFLEMQAALQGALDSATDTNRVLAQRVKTAYDALPTIIHFLSLGLEEADKDEPNDGYETLYNAAAKASGGLNILLHDLNGGHPLSEKEESSQRGGTDAA